MNLKYIKGSDYQSTFQLSAIMQERPFLDLINTKYNI